MHHIFQRTGMTPDAVQAKPPGVQAFLYASMMVQLEEEANGREGENGG